MILVSLANFGNRRLAAPSRLALLPLVAAGVWFALRLVAWGQCSWYGYETSRTTRYSPFIGCMIQTPAGWIPRAELRIVQ